MGILRGLLGIAAGLLLAAGGARAGGTLFGEAGPVRGTEYRAAVRWESGRETLILEVRYAGHADRFGWVIPVPSLATVAGAPPAIFDSLEGLARPEVVAPDREGIAAAEAEARGEIGSVAPVPHPGEAHPVVGADRPVVLEAPDAGVLRAWLAEHGYSAASRRGESPLLDAGASRYYVAMCVEPAMLERELLARLRSVDPAIQTLREAPAGLARLLLEEADRGAAAGREHARAIGKALDRVLAGRARVEGGAEESGFEERLPRAYETAMRLQMAVRREPLPASAMEMGLERLAEGHGEQQLLAAAAAEGLDRCASLQDLAHVLRQALCTDLEQRVPYCDSHWRRWHSLLGLLSPASAGRRAGAKTEYEWLVELKTGLAGMPTERSADEESIGRLDRMATRVTDQLVRRAAWDLLAAAAARSELYHSAHESLATAVSAAGAARHAGRTEPLRLEFETPQLILPMGCGNPHDSTRSQLRVYVLADHRMKAEGFQTAFAARLDVGDLEWRPDLAGLVDPWHGYLTELRAELPVNGTAGEVVITRALTDRGCRGRTTADGQQLGRAQAALYRHTGWVVSRRFVWRQGLLLAVLLLLGGVFVVRRARRPHLSSR